MTGKEPAYEIPPYVLHRQVEDQMVLLNLETEQYFGLDSVGAHIVTRVTEKPLEEALAVLLQDYEVSPEVLRQDVDRLIEALLAAGLLAVVDEGA